MAWRGLAVIMVPMLSGEKCLEQVERDRSRWAWAVEAPPPGAGQVCARECQGGSSLRGCGLVAAGKGLGRHSGFRDTDISFLQNNLYFKTVGH